ncbi:hypothetical protein [Chlamydia pneumoniae]|uniref:Uncharacterized protein n=3 Tax=Chlamydia pneumoniae TaxID=83558 RepID=Q9K1Y3_CHLPN|nr:hypothetical protein [Chlamydia pneumoniae]AAF38593.1 hypothetical protein CP_0794 [Chlamydia pneumoniae AR39]CRI33598.1 Uncharacterized protein BN1224_Wien1_A_11050 [Chlamydia pneumoniae]CRI36464.1 Uncharacterized protein BN1224_CM1_A_11110 [Chlamydia pneumoniae]CRI37586.1 Uncharacterized protein BN1224_CV14_A_11050 [Chlamydia pneumoniae]CRI38719.1 Uncharacterized protein BN1224_CV15_C_05520 [Chlamydia pneumoniae]
MLSRVEEIEMMLRVIELPLLPIKQALEKAFVQYNSYKAKLTKVEPCFRESPAYITSEERLQSLDQTLERAYKEYQKRFQEPSRLESEVSGCREHLREQVKQFETQGLDLIKEELIFVSDVLFRKMVSCLVSTVHVPFMEFYYEYFELHRLRLRAQWMANAEIYSKVRKAFPEMLKETLEKAKAPREEEYWLLCEERKSKEKRLILNKIEAAQQRVKDLEPPPIKETGKQKRKKEYSFFIRLKS